MNREELLDACAKLMGPSAEWLAGYAAAREQAARYLDGEADALDAQRHDLITTGTLGGRRVVTANLRRRLARDNRVIIDKLAIDAAAIRAMVPDAEKPPTA